MHPKWPKHATPNPSQQELRILNYITIFIIYSCILLNVRLYAFDLKTQYTKRIRTQLYYTILVGSVIYTTDTDFTTTTTLPI